jgi:hypothetical protein
LITVTRQAKYGESFATFAIKLLAMPMTARKFSVLLLTTWSGKPDLSESRRPEVLAAIRAMIATAEKLAADE